MNRNLYYLEWGVVVDMVHVGQGQYAGVTAGAAKAARRFSGIEVSLEQGRRQSTRPLIEITKHKARRLIASVFIRDIEQLL